LDWVLKNATEVVAGYAFRVERFSLLYIISNLIAVFQIGFSFNLHANLHANIIVNYTKRQYNSTKQMIK